MSLLKLTVGLLFGVSIAAYAAPAKRVVNDPAAEAIPAAKENRIVRFTYSPDVIFRVITMPTLHTHLELGEDEGLKEQPVIGDSAQWRVSGGPRNLYIKPVRDDIETSLTVVTNKRTYQFQLIANSKAGSVFQKVSFDYPDREAEIKLRQDVEAGKVAAEQSRLDSQVVASNLDPSTLNFDFDISGNASFKPTAVYTDGKFTYLRVPNSQDSPAVFLVDDAGNPSLVNYQVKGNLIIVERVAQRLLLKLGAAEVAIKRHGTSDKF